MRSFETFGNGKNSYVVPGKELRLYGCFTILKVKRSIYEELCDDALKGVKRELAAYFYENGVEVPLTTENKLSGNWIAVVMPDAIPSRLVASQRPCQPFPAWIRPAVTRASPTSPAAPPQSEPSSPPLITDLLSTDRSQALDLLHAWRNHFNHPLKNPPQTEHPTTLQAYLSSHTATNPWIPTLLFALGLHLHASELALLDSAIRAATTSLLLTKDYWTWPRVCRSADNNARLSNAVAVVMAEHGLSEAKARESVKRAAVDAEMEILERKAEILDGSGDERGEVGVFLEGLEQFVGGCGFWWAAGRGR
ncbi:hypothetical protein WHR41_03912 [Cladosporium halotolerans]|uniref:Uncharacterized protein n=1 Tax=Cladosporium halotolerans TaxID=1052096 RepID=A0AB34KQI4_9PEZI